MRGILVGAKDTVRRFIFKRIPRRIDLDLLTKRVEMLEKSSLRDPEMFQRAQKLHDLLRSVPSGHRFSRIGGQSDGGYVVPVDMGFPEEAISIGVGDEHQADVDLANMGVVVYEFDHTVAAPPSRHENIRFSRLGVGTQESSEFNPDIISIEEMLAFLKSPKETWILLDAEGAEWGVLGDIARSKSVSVLCIELHRLGDLVVTDGFKWQELRLLLEEFSVVSAHANDLTPLYFFGNVPIPDTVELTLVRRVHFKKGTASVPDALLRPNDPWVSRS